MWFGTQTHQSISSVPRRVFPKDCFFSPQHLHIDIATASPLVSLLPLPLPQHSLLSLFLPPTQPFLHSAVRAMAFKISVRDHHSCSISANGFPFLHRVKASIFSNLQAFHNLPPLPPPRTVLRYCRHAYAPGPLHCLSSAGSCMAHSFMFPSLCSNVTLSMRPVLNPVFETVTLSPFFASFSSVLLFTI